MLRKDAIFGDTLLPFEKSKLVSLAFAHSVMSTCQEFTQRLCAGSSDDFQVSTCNHKANSYQYVALSPSSITKD